MAQSMLLRRGGGPVCLDRLLYTGRMLYDIRFMGNKAYHLFIFETSGVLSVIGSLTGDIWMCGGGGAGTNGRYNNNTNSGTAGAGGGGGSVFNAFNVPILDGVVTIGAGLAAAAVDSNRQLYAGTTSYLTYSAAGGGSSYVYNTYPAYYALGGSGGCGGAGGTSERCGSGAGISTRPFLCSDMRPQCGGGGCGSYSASTIKTPGGGSDGGNATQAIQNAESPGAGDGGMFGGGGGGMDGGSGGSNGSPGSTASGAANVGAGGGTGYGGGGGGAGLATSSNNAPRGGTGSPGALMIRIPV